MQPIHSQTRHEIAISITRHQKTTRSLDSPTEAGGLAFRLHHLAGNIVPLRLCAVKGRKLFPLTVLVCAAHDAQRDGSGGSRPAAGMSTGVVSRSSLVGAPRNRFQTEHQLNFLQSQRLEEIDEAQHEFESTS